MSDSSSWCTPLRRLAYILRGMLVCVYCQRPLAGAAPAMITLDHLVPVRVGAGGGHRGADHGPRNIVLCCARCNSARGNMPWRRYAAQFPGAITRVNNQRRRRLNLALSRDLLAQHGRPHIAVAAMAHTA